MSGIVYQSVSLYFTEGSSDKEYHARFFQDGADYVVDARWGRRGNPNQSQEKYRGPYYDMAERKYNTIVSEKRAKGYTEGPDGVPFTSITQQDEHSGVYPQLLNDITKDEARKLLKDEAWCMQEKHDGERRLVERVRGEVRGINRRGLYVSIPQPIADTLLQVEEHSFILDAEIVDNVIWVFDILDIEGAATTGEPYSERLQALTDMLRTVQNEHVKLVTTAWTETEKRALLKAVGEHNGEGVVFKLLSASYSPGRPNSGGDQLKHKFYATATARVRKLNDKRSVETEMYDGSNWVSTGSCTVPPNYVMPDPGALVEIRYLYAMPGSNALYQPTYLGARPDMTDEDAKLTQLQYKGTGAAAAANA